MAEQQKSNNLSESNSNVDQREILEKIYNFNSEYIKEFLSTLWFEMQIRCLDFDMIGLIEKFEKKDTVKLDKPEDIAKHMLMVSNSTFLFPVRTGNTTGISRTKLVKLL